MKDSSVDSKKRIDGSGQSKMFFQRVSRKKHTLDNNDSGIIKLDHSSSNMMDIDDSDYERKKKQSSLERSKRIMSLLNSNNLQPASIHENTTTKKDEGTKQIDGFKESLDVAHLKMTITRFKKEVSELTTCIDMLKRRLDKDRQEKDIMQSQIGKLHKQLSENKGKIRDFDKIKYKYDELLALYMKVRSGCEGSTSTGNEGSYFVGDSDKKRHLDRLEDGCQDFKMSEESKRSLRVNKEKNFMKDQACVTFGSRESSFKIDVSLQDESTSLAGLGSSERDCISSLKKKLMDLQLVNQRLVEELESSNDRINELEKKLRQQNTKPQENRSISFNRLSSMIRSELGTKRQNSTKPVRHETSDEENDIIEVSLKPEKEEEEQTPRFEQSSRNQPRIDNKMRHRSETKKQQHLSSLSNNSLCSTDHSHPQRPYSSGKEILSKNKFSTSENNITNPDHYLNSTCGTRAGPIMAKLVKQKHPSNIESYQSAYKRQWGVQSRESFQ